MFRHPALPGLHAGNAAARRSLKSSGKKATRGHINKAGPSRPPGAALPPPSLQKRDFLPSAFRARSGHSPGPSPRGPNQWEGSFCSGAGGPGSLEGERRPAASCRRAPGSGRPRGPRGARRAARVLVGAHGRREPTPRCGRGAFPRRCRRPPFGAPRLRWSRRLGRRRLRGPAPRANPRAPAAALRTPLPPAPCPLPRAVSFGSTGVWGRRGRSWPPRPPSSGALGGEGAEG